MGCLAFIAIVYYLCSMIYYASKAFDSRTQIKIQGERVHIPKIERRLTKT